jgi:hypothetical protein
MKLYIPKDREAHNILIAGATGSRKSSILNGFADQAIARGWPCIFTDLKRSYLAEYYDPDNDFIINFADDRCVRWMLNREFTSRLEAQTVSHALIKHETNSIPYFVNGSRDILAFLLGIKQMPIKELLEVVGDTDSLLDALWGSGLERLLKGSEETASGFTNNIGNALSPIRLLPQEEGRVEFCIREWCMAGKKRKGNIFFASSANDFPAQQKLQALMIDLLLAGMQQYPGPGCCIFDEIGVYGEIPSYEKALSIQRSSGNPIISAFQSFSQLRQNYGPDRAKTIASNPYTKIMMAMDCPDEARYTADLLGLPSELERVKESVDANMFKDSGKKHHSYSTDRPMVNAVLGGEMQNLADGHGYMKMRGVGITHFYVNWRPAKKNQPDFIPRVWPQWIMPEKPAKKPAPAPQEAKPKREYKSKYKDVQLPI